MSFKKWLKKRLDEDSPIGDLADDSVGNDGWTGNCPTTLLLAMRRGGASWGAEEALLEAMYEWGVECETAKLEVV